MDFNRRALVLICSLISSICFIQCAHRASFPAAAESSSLLREELDELFGDPQFANAHWGVVIRSLETGETLYQRNGNKGFMPASNMKLFTTAAALVALGPEFQYTTDICATAAVDSEGVLQGDLVIRGKGDPSISGRYTDGEVTAVFRAWADSLKAHNIRSVSGRIIGDDRYFDHEILGDGWSWDYQSDYYAAQISALSFNENCVNIVFSPGDSIGALARFRLEPETLYISVDNQVITGDEQGGSEIYLARKRGTNEVICRGRLSVSESEKRDWVTVEDPGKFAAVVLRDCLSAAGIRVHGEATTVRELQEGLDRVDRGQLIFQHQSPPLKELIRTTNKVSQNLFAELLFRTVGRNVGGQGNANTAEKVEKELFADMGIAPAYLAIADGSGLSRLNLVTPNSVAQLLTYVRRHAYGEVFYSSLPIAGEDGTISSRMIGTAAQNNVRAKTGYIGRVRALSGYVTTRDGEELVFSMIVNNYTVPTSLANTVQDRVCERLANFRR
ncbi:MAG TPA: D-alanyl-D-alanine carboxypeptidase/D-alanyl-D-alanine-endopeptidase [bacterium]|mgnify:CR=1 FL=1|nr:D-alanyl-D-alanine carboxypeptidase/D-alanyl-D-alanine-endopeptidase [bacterium]HOX84618.1 D-alanyl-D-alanine carboxypeptidase/D-alanyl-D-alanine-endopeptidase [bacterium]HPG45341.1 D-alanyl-D-alanine carboxypeptidase/D-alanyl-D-alanine-endopeptidase [bacterium]HPM98940.1 D-alanyl-D-alanine carboxypeptidase/D-alanyl-D-alanine-endopeptidase [bacterium]